MEEFTYSATDYILEGASWDEAKTGRTLTKFDLRLRKKWDDLMAAGHFRYTLDHVKSRIVTGRERYIIELNLKRGIQRRTPEHISSVNKPYDPDKFNFTKVKGEEIICALRPKEDEIEHPPDTESGSAVNGAGHGKGAEVIASNGDRSKTDTGRHVMLINVSPLGYGHALVVCDVNDQIYQKMSLKAHQMAIETVLLSNHPGFRVGFNSLCALASVNHQHFHTWYMDEPLSIENAATRSICPGLYEMIGKPTRAFVLQLHGYAVEEISRMACAITDFFLENNVAHNVFLTRAPAIGTENGGRTVRIYIWPRKSVLATKINPKIPGMKNESGSTIFNVAVAELAGFIPMYVAEAFDDITEEQINEIIQKDLLPDDEFDRLRDQISALLQPIASQ